MLHAVLEAGEAGLAAAALETGMFAAVDTVLDAELGARFISAEAVYQISERSKASEARIKQAKRGQKLTVFAVGQVVGMEEVTIVAVNVALDMVLFVENTVLGDNKAGMPAATLGAFEV